MNGNRRIQKIKNEIDKLQEELKDWSEHTSDATYENGNFEDEHDYEMWYFYNRGDINYIKGLQEAIKIFNKGI